jgi:hypothetical protein
VGICDVVSKKRVRRWVSTGYVGVCVGFGAERGERRSEVLEGEGDRLWAGSCSTVREGGTMALGRSRGITILPEME